MDCEKEFDLSALDIQIPNADEIIKKYRRQYTTDGANGMPPHITLLYPFLKQDEYKQHTHDILVEVISNLHPFTIEFGGLARFPGILYLKTSQEEKIRSIIRKLVHAFPSFPPYGGNFSINELTPHMTVAVDPSETKLDNIERVFKHEIDGINMESHFVEHLTFSVRSLNQWTQLSTFDLKDV